MGVCCTLPDVDDRSGPQREYPVREVFNGLRWIVRAGAPWRMLPNDLPPWEAVYQQTRRRLQADVFEAMVNDLRALLRLAAAAQGIRLGVIKSPQAKKGFVLLPCRWVVERDFAWIARFRRLARDYEHLPQTLVRLHFLAFAILMLHRFIHLMVHCL